MLPTMRHLENSIRGCTCSTGYSYVLAGGSGVLYYTCIIHKVVSAVQWSSGTQACSILGDREIPCSVFPDEMEWVSYIPREYLSHKNKSSSDYPSEVDTDCIV